MRYYFTRPVLYETLFVAKIHHIKMVKMNFKFIFNILRQIFTNYFTLGKEKPLPSLNSWLNVLCGSKNQAMFI